MSEFGLVVNKKQLQEHLVIDIKFCNDSSCKREAAACVISKARYRHIGVSSLTKDALKARVENAWSVDQLKPS